MFDTKGAIYEPLLMADPSLLPTLRQYVGFDDASAQRLQKIAPRMRRFYQGIVDQFYEAILEDPRARAVLKNEAQVRRLHVSLRGWLEGLFSGPYDEQYFEKRARIGRMHVKVGLDQRYMLSAMNLIRVGLHRGLSEISTPGLGQVLDHRAIDQICDIELAIMLETYREDYVLKKTAEAESLAVMGRLTAGLAHEVRNPLNAAKLQLDVLRRNAAGVRDESTRRKIERRTNLVQDELRRLSLLLDDFLNLARARNLDPVRCEAGALLTEVIELRRPEIESQGIEFIDDIEYVPCELDAERDRQIEAATGLRQVSRGEIDRDAALREVEAALEYGAPHAVARLADRHLRKADDREARQAARQMHLHGDRRCLEAALAAAVERGESHPPSLADSTSVAGVPVSVRRALRLAGAGLEFGDPFLEFPEQRAAAGEHRRLHLEFLPGHQIHAGERAAEHPAKVLLEVALHGTQALGDGRREPAGKAVYGFFFHGALFIAGGGERPGPNPVAAPGKAASALSIMMQSSIPAAP